MTKFKYITDEDLELIEGMEYTEKVLIEVAYQVKRIADKLEFKVNK